MHKLGMWREVKIKQYYCLECKQWIHDIPGEIYDTVIICGRCSLAICPENDSNYVADEVREEFLCLSCNIATESDNCNDCGKQKENCTCEYCDDCGDTIDNCLCGDDCCDNYCNDCNEYKYDCVCD